MSQSPLAQLEQANKRVKDAGNRRHEIQVKLESARQQYAEAVKEAESAHGTADIDKLRAILVKQEDDNQKAIAEFVRAVDDFESFISRIEKALNDPEAMTALLAAMPSPAPAPIVEAKPAAVQFIEDDI